MQELIAHYWWIAVAAFAVAAFLVFRKRLHQQ
jgi:hypothetical protein